VGRTQEAFAGAPSVRMYGVLQKGHDELAHQLKHDGLTSSCGATDDRCKLNVTPSLTIARPGSLQQARYTLAAPGRRFYSYFMRRLWVEDDSAACE